MFVAQAAISSPESSHGAPVTEVILLRLDADETAGYWHPRPAKRPRARRNALVSRRPERSPDGDHAGRHCEPGAMRCCCRVSAGDYGTLEFPVDGAQRLVYGGLGTGEDTGLP
jgi:hypothetical protein